MRKMWGLWFSFVLAAAPMAGTAAPDNPEAGFDQTLAMARALCDGGASEGALRLLAKLQRDFPLEVQQYVLTAMIAEESGALDTALDAAYKLAREVYWPAYADMDRKGVCHDAKTHETTVPESMHKIWQAVKEGGWVGETGPADFSGL